MSRFIQLHLLTSYPPANLNRDDLGRPKTAKMGGFDRLRVSSPSLNRAWRTSELFQQAMSGHIGTRTKEMGLKIYQKFIEKDVQHKSAIEWSGKIAGVFGKLKTLSNKEKEKIKELPEEERKKKELLELEIEQLAHFSPEEEKEIGNLVDKIIDRGSGPEKDELKLMRDGASAVDITLFGRMLASAPEYSVEAACQVAHAISVHPVVIEDDYFTAVDDLNDRSEDAGAAHIGETGFAAGLFYSYICINRELLTENLGGDEEMARKGIKAFTEAAIKVAPTGKQNSFGSRAYASYVLAEKGDQQPRSLSVAFLKPITPRDSDDFGSAAVVALSRQQQNMDEVYGDCADDRRIINTFTGEGTLEELLTFVSK
jgi:CRISPR system Cascade subunit CasC